MSFCDSFGTFGSNFDSQFFLVTSPIFSSAILTTLRLAIAVYTTVTIILDIILSDTIDHDVSRYYRLCLARTNQLTRILPGGVHSSRT